MNDLKDIIRKEVLDKYKEANIELFEDIRIALIDDFITRKNIANIEGQIDILKKAVDCVLIDGGALEEAINAKINSDLQGFIKFFMNIIEITMKLAEKSHE